MASAEKPKGRRKPNRSKHRPPATLEVERLEDRIVPATPLGPGLQINGTRDLTGTLAEDVTGRITALAIGQDESGTPAAFLGSASGGIFRSTNFTTNSPTWTPLTDSAGMNGTGTGPAVDPQTGFGAGAIDVGSIAVDPTNPRIIYAGTGEPTSGRYGTGVLMSIDGGDSFRLLPVTGAPFFRHSISKIIVDPLNHTTWR
jgi:hypothetical protein